MGVTLSGARVQMPADMDVMYQDMPGAYSRMDYGMGYYDMPGWGTSQGHPPYAIDHLMSAAGACCGSCISG